MKVSFIYNAHDDAKCINDPTRKRRVVNGKHFHPPSISMLCVYIQLTDCGKPYVRRVCVEMFMSYPSVYIVG